MFIHDSEEISKLSEKQLNSYKASAAASVAEIKRITEKVALQKKGGAELTESEKNIAQ